MKRTMNFLLTLLLLAASVFPGDYSHAAELTDNRLIRSSSATLVPFRDNQPIAYLSDIAASRTDATDALTLLMTGTEVADGSITTAKLANGAVTDRKIAGNSVAEGHLKGAAVTTAKIANNAVVEGKIADSAVTEAKLAANSVNTVEIRDGAVTEAKLAQAVRNMLGGSSPSGPTTIADNSILPGKAQAGTEAQKRAWRARFASSRIGQVSGALPAVADYNAGDLLIVGRGGTTTVTFVDLDAPATQLTTTVAGDLIMILSNRWTRVGNLFSGGIAAAAARTIADANQAKLNRLAVFEQMILTPQGIPGNDFPAFMGLYLGSKLVNKTITQIQVSLGGQVVANVVRNTSPVPPATNLMEPFNNGVPELSGGIINLGLNASARSNLKTNTPSSTQFIEGQVAYTFSDGTSHTDRLHFATNNNGYPAPGGGLSQSQVDARVLALRSLVPTNATPAVGDRFFFTDENQSGDPLRYVQMRDLSTAMGVKFTEKAGTAGAARTWTYTLGATDTEIYIGTDVVGQSSSNTSFSSILIFRGLLSGTIRYFTIDHRNPAQGQSPHPDAQSIGIGASISGNTLTLNNTGWGNSAKPVVYSR